MPQSRARCQISSKSGDFHFLSLFVTILPLFNPRFVPLNTKIFENEFQIQILNPKARLGTKLHQNRIIFIFCLFGGSYLSCPSLTPISPPKYQNFTKLILDSGPTPQSCARYQISSKSDDFYFFFFSVGQGPLLGLKDVKG